MGSFVGGAAARRRRYAVGPGPRVLGCGPGEMWIVRAMLRLVQRSERARCCACCGRGVLHICRWCCDGSQRIIHVEAEPEFNEHGHGVGYTGIVQDVTDRRAAEDSIRHLANFDSLTGLPNRRQLVWRMERAIEHARRLGHPCAFLMIDLDRFKIINDTLGHAAGDELLMEVAQRLRACVRHSDQVMEGALETVGSRAHRSLEAVGRLGGDEFIALLPEIHDERDAQRVADRILEVMRDPVLVGGQECFVTASVGIAIFPRDGGTVADLMRNPTWRVLGQVAGQVRVGHLQPAASRGREKQTGSALHRPSSATSWRCTSPRSTCWRAWSASRR